MRSGISSVSYLYKEVKVLIVKKLTISGVASKQHLGTFFFASVDRCTGYKLKSLLSVAEVSTTFNRNKEIEKVFTWLII